MNLTVQFSGGQQIAAVLEKMADAPKRQTSIKALRAGAEPIRAAAARLCRRGEEGPPHLADNIGIKVVRETLESGAEETTVAIGVPKEFFYDYFLEYGTEHSSAYPFYRPALAAQGPMALEVIRKAYWAAIAEQAPKGLPPP